MSNKTNDQEAILKRLFTSKKDLGYLCAIYDIRADSVHFQQCPILSKMYRIYREAVLHLQIHINREGCISSKVTTTVL